MATLTKTDFNAAQAARMLGPEQKTCLLTFVTRWQDQWAQDGKEIKFGDRTGAEPLGSYAAFAGATQLADMNRVNLMNRVDDGAFSLTKEGREVVKALLVELARANSA